MQFTDLLDIAVVASLLWVALVWLRNSRARLALLGLAILAGIYLLAAQLQLGLTVRILQGFFAVSLFVGVVVFQDELRRVFERLGVWGSRRAPRRTAPDIVAAISGAARTLSERREGALIVLPGREPLARHTEGGVHLRGRVSEALLLSLFDHHSPGHDGATVLEGNEIARFGVHLPLSSDREALGSHGTRHAAALGLAERSDALCLIVSEESGQISIARNGVLRAIAPMEVEEVLLHFFQRLRPPTSSGAGALASRLAVHWREGLIAIVTAATLWFLLVPGSSIARVERFAPVVVENLPAGFELASVEPPEIGITIEGLRRDVLLANPSRISVRIDGLLAQLGRRTFEVTADSIDLPEALRVVEIKPRKVRLNLRTVPPAERP